MVVLGQGSVTDIAGSGAYAVHAALECVPLPKASCYCLSQSLAEGTDLIPYLN